ncbi:hypothetical protein OWM07_07170 [Deferribacter thermophilus]|uniref:hypothetical protein n=1 Tax=Deferribacter thermophilus TaxID=53573 RepID=UPI003C16446E
MNRYICSFEENNIFPVVIDFDFKNIKCRGYSLLLDFIYRGEVFDTISTLETLKMPIYIKKETFLFKSGFFLYDFSFIKDSIKDFVNFIKNLNFNRIYIEKSNFLSEDEYNLLAKKFDLVVLELK